jgi:hypothetical protein
MSRTRVRVGAKERYKVSVCLFEHCKAIGDGIAMYEEGWNDERVAKETKVSFWSVKYIRQEAIGKLQPTPNGLDTQANDPRVGALIDRMTHLEQVVTSLIDALGGLPRTISEGDTPNDVKPG